MKFLMDRQDGKPFKDVTGYSQVMKAEGNLKEFKKKFGYI